MPIVPLDDWPAIYDRFLTALLDVVPLARITLGCICSYAQARRLMDLKLGPENGISARLHRQRAGSADGRLRFGRVTREEVYRCLIGSIRRRRPEVEIGLCLEDAAMFAALGLQESLGRCNCVL